MDHDFITIVSGLPRSGTSMMMQMLDAGGLPAVTDNIRTRDEDNPRGYYEFEPVKKTREDPSWIPTARGKVVKMVYRLLYDLPQGFEYRVVFMRRNMDEVLASQEKMLQRSGRQGGSATPEQMAALFRRELDKVDDWLHSQPHFSVMDVQYHKMIADPAPLCEALNAFLGGRMDVRQMAAVVDPSLYRNRS